MPLPDEAVIGAPGARKWATMSDLDLVIVMRDASIDAETLAERTKAQVEYVDRFNKSFRALAP